MVTRPHSLLPEFPRQDAGMASGMRPGVKSGLSEGRLADGSFRAGDGAEVATQASTRWKGKSEDRRAEPSRSAACPPSLSPLRAGRGPSHGGRRPVLVPSPPPSACLSPWGSDRQSLWCVSAEQLGLGPPWTHSASSRWQLSCARRCWPHMG